MSEGRLDLTAEYKKALDALGVTIIKPGELHVDFLKFIEGIGQKRAEALLTIIADRYGIGTVMVKKQEGAMPAVHRSSA